MKIPHDTNLLIALLEGRFDELAVELIYNSGVLSLHRDHGVPKSIGSVSRDAFKAFDVTKETLRLTPDEDTALADAVYAGVQQREEVAYLLGVAVGRRLGQMRLSGAAFKKGGGER